MDKSNIVVSILGAPRTDRHNSMRTLPLLVHERCVGCVLASIMVVLHYALCTTTHSLWLGVMGRWDRVTESEHN